MSTKAEIYSKNSIDSQTKGNSKCSIDNISQQIDHSNKSVDHLSNSNTESVVHISEQANTSPSHKELSGFITQQNGNK